MKVLGLSAFYHDSAAALIVDGRIVAAAQEERFTRRKHDAAYPRHAVAYCLKEGALRPDQLDRVAFYDKPFLKFERLLETQLAFAPRGFTSFRRAIPVWIRDKLFQKFRLTERLREHDPSIDWATKLLFSEHHLSHAASAFYPSPFADAVVLTLDGVGEWTTTSVWHGEGAALRPLRELQFPHSLGLLYSAFTYYTGFKVNSGEYKVMGLAPYGQPRFAGKIFEELIDLKPDGSFRINQEYFDYCTGLRMTHPRFARLFGLPVRKPEEPLTQAHMDLAASIQAVTEEVLLRITRSLAAEKISRNLCLAGGVALNCVANGRVLRDGRFARLWIQPAAGDAGGALGAALVATHLHGELARPEPKGDAMAGGYLGPSFSEAQIVASLRATGARFHRLLETELIARAADELAAGKALGWFQGRMEFGPRALGARSILADPRSPAMQSRLNLQTKFRESFRPFAPSVLREEVSEWFELTEDSPYMLLVAEVRKDRRLIPRAENDATFGIERLHVPRSTIPAVTHVDYTARIQTVHRETQPRYHALLSAFKARTGCPVLVNTSFNVRGEPIVGSPEDAFRCFMGTDLELLCIGDFLLVKSEQDPALRTRYEGSFSPD